MHIANSGGHFQIWGLELVYHLPALTIENMFQAPLNNMLGDNAEQTLPLSLQGVASNAQPT